MRDRHWQTIEGWQIEDDVVIGSLVRSRGIAIYPVKRSDLKPHDDIGVVEELKAPSSRGILALVQWLRYLPTGTLYVFHENTLQEIE